MKSGRYINKYKDERESVAELEFNADTKSGLAALPGFLGDQIMRFFVGDKVIDQQRENWDRITDNARRIKESPSSYINPSDPAWMQVHGGAYIKYIENLSTEDGKSIHQKMGEETFADTLNIVADEAKNATKIGSESVKWAVVGVALLLAFQVLTIFT